MATAGWLTCDPLLGSHSRRESIVSLPAEPLFRARISVELNLGLITSDDHLRNVLRDQVFVRDFLAR
jgi:hypothetical protein